jgi:hypothetical protein
MDIKTEFKEKENLINHIETNMILKSKLEKDLDEQRLKILDEQDENGKKKYSNELQRQNALIKVKPKEVDQLEKTCRELEISRLKFSLISDKINFLIKVEK